MQRREFIAGFSGAAALPVMARAQQNGRVQRIGILMPHHESDPDAKGYISAFLEELAASGWTDGRNVRMEVRWAAGNVDRMRILAKELVDLQSDAVLVTSTPATAALQQETRTIPIPIVFAGISDPVGAGFVASLPRPGGNLTGFINIEAALGGKWLELLTEIAPGVKRAAIMFNPKAAAGAGSYFLPSFEAAARLLRLQPIVAPVDSETERETVMGSLGQGDGLVIPGDIFTVSHRTQIIRLAASNNVPAVYFQSSFAREDGLLSYGADQQDLFRRSADYVGRILRGAKPSELPVQVPTKFELVINLNTAKALRLPVPQSILLRADEVIE
jgi:putative tryptophan/tyrosine transport system substrate-binding protein